MLRASKLLIRVCCLAEIVNIYGGLILSLDSMYLLRYPASVNLFRFFSRVANQLGCKGIWWDTISVPVEKKARCITINNMHENYKRATVTLIHDCYLSKIELQILRVLDDGILVARRNPASSCQQVVITIIGNLRGGDFDESNGFNSLLISLDLMT